MRCAMYVDGESVTWVEMLGFSRGEVCKICCITFLLLYALSAAQAHCCRHYRKFCFISLGHSDDSISLSPLLDKYEVSF